jgi:hypothetical protein
MTSVAYGLAFPATRGVLGVPSSSLFDPASLFPANGGYWNVAKASLDGKLWQADGATPAGVGDGVGKVWDYSGNGNHLLQATASKCPILRNSGALWWLEFDGVDDYLRATFTLNQPLTRVAAAQQVSWTSGDRLWEGSGVFAPLMQTGSSPTVGFGGGSSITSSDMTVGANHVVTEIRNSTSSKLAIDNNSYATGDAGTINPAGLTLAAQNTGSSAYCNLLWFGGVWIAGVMSDPNIASCRTFLGGLAGLSL